MEMVVKSTDLLVIGGGLAGLMSAHAAVDSGIKDITVLREGGGASTDVFGINILGSRRVETEKDSYDTYFRDTLESGCGINDKDLASVLVRGTEKIKEIIARTGLGIENSEEFTFVKPLGSSYPRCAFYNDKKSIGVILMAFLSQKIRDYGAREVNSVSITHLLKDNDRVVGACGFNTKTYEQVIIKAKATILATGGFSNIYDFTTTFSTLNGSCHIAAYNSGAELMDLEFVQFEPCVCIYPESVRGLAITTTMLNDGAKLYNGNKDTFIEGQYPNKNILSLAMYREIAEGRATENGGLYFDATVLEDSFIEKAYPSFITKYKKGGIDIRKNMLQVAPAAHYSCGGIRIDKDCRTSIEGLYACGEATGGIHGANRIGGNAGAEILVFGNIAGSSSSDYISGTDLDIGDSLIKDKVEEIKINLKNNVSCSIDYGKIRKEIKSIISLSANVIRNRDSLEQGINKLKLLKKETSLSISENSSGRDKYNYFRTESMIDIGILLLTSALKRRESRGTHYRSDYRERDDKNFLGNIIIKKGQEGPQLILKEITVR